MNFDEKYSTIKQYASKELSIIEDKLVSSVNIIEPLNSHLKKFLISPSKRIRSVLPILYTKALGEELSNQQLDLLCAIELVHNASLIHDDIIDESDLRRNKKTINAEFGNKLAVISGDYLLSIAMDIITNLNSKDILEKFISTIRQMCIGEINQNFNRFKIGTIDEYIEKSKNKTAYLFETAFKCCTILGTHSQNMDISGKIGLNIGIAFQIRDDILNLVNTDKSKPVNNDLKDGIYNAPIIYSGSIENYTQGIEKTRDLLNNYIEKAKIQISKLPENEFKKKIYDFLELLIND